MPDFPTLVEIVRPARVAEVVPFPRKPAFAQSHTRDRALTFAQLAATIDIPADADEAKDLLRHVVMAARDVVGGRG